MASGNRQPPTPIHQFPPAPANPSPCLPPKREHCPCSLFFPKGRAGCEDEGERSETQNEKRRASAACTGPPAPKSEPPPRQDQPDDDKKFNAIRDEGAKHGEPGSTKADDGKTDWQDAARCAQQGEQTRAANDEAAQTCCLTFKCFCIRHHATIYASCSDYRSKWRMITWSRLGRHPGVAAYRLKRSATTNARELSRRPGGRPRGGGHIQMPKFPNSASSNGAVTLGFRSMMRSRYAAWRVTRRTHARPWSNSDASISPRFKPSWRSLENWNVP